MFDTMILRDIMTLGDTVQTQYRQANYDDAQFPTIAENALRNFKLEFSLKDAIKLQFSNTLPEQINFAFSSLPITVYSTQEFYIEILIWTSASTSVHQHSFAGAFKVLQGSSFHAEYKFTEQHRVSPLLYFGSVIQGDTSQLKTGDIRQILPGRNGLTHSLYHLDQPSVTLVIRTSGEAWSQPQLDLIRPGMALDTITLDSDPAVLMAWRTYNTLLTIQDQSLWQQWITGVAKMDFPRAAAVCNGLSAALHESAILVPLIDALITQHGEHANELATCLTHEAARQEMVATRSHMHNAEHRYFIALLINASSRENLLQLLTRAFPEKNPVELCIKWLIELGDPTALLTTAQKTHHTLGVAQSAPPVLMKLIRAKNQCPDDYLHQVLENVITGTAENTASMQLPEDALQAQQFYQSMPYLSIFNT